MKTFVGLIAVLCVIAIVESSTYGQAPLPLGSKLTGPPCPKSVVVGCAPLVQTVPCKSGYSSVGAYTEQYPQYVQPTTGNAVQGELAGSASTYYPQYYVPQQYPVQYVPQYSYN